MLAIYPQICLMLSVINQISYLLGILFSLSNIYLYYKKMTWSYSG